MSSSICVASSGRARCKAQLAAQTEATLKGMLATRFGVGWPASTNFLRGGLLGYGIWLALLDRGEFCPFHFLLPPSVRHARPVFVFLPFKWLFWLLNFASPLFLGCLGFASASTLVFSFAFFAQN
ncbi:MAG: hypothetical protein HS114_19255 [Anaerolineales bacterium]|nr:hypothetical protein [Anaerolineales bacterium]